MEGGKPVHQCLGDWGWGLGYVWRERGREGSEPQVLATGAQCRCKYVTLPGLSCTYWASTCLCIRCRAHARPAGDREEEVRISGPMTPPTPEAGALPRERLAEQGVGSRHGEAEIRGAGDGCWSAEGHEVGSLGAGKGGEGSRGVDGCTAGTEGRVAAQCQT